MILKEKDGPSGQDERSKAGHQQEQDGALGSDLAFCPCAHCCPTYAVLSRSPSITGSNHGNHLYCRRLTSPEGLFNALKRPFRR